MRKWTWMSILLVLCCGCAQQTGQMTAQPTGQTQAAMTEQGALGSTTHVNFAITQNAAGRTREPNALEAALKEDADGRFAVEGFAAGDAELASAAGTGDVQIIVFDVQSGGSSTGAQAGGSASGQSAQPGATSTITAEQRPEASVQVPVTTALPGGAASGSASGATGQGTATLSAEQQAELRTALTELRQTNPQAAERLGQVLGVVFGPGSREQGASAPATQPAEEGGG